MVHRALIFALAMLVAIATNTFADQWPQPTESGVISADGRIAVRLTPGSSWGEVWGFAGAPLGDHARARFYRLDGDEGTYLFYQELALLNPVAPVFAAVSNEGALVTLDNWHNMGFGPVLAIYSPAGAVVRSYTLEELYRPEQIDKFMASVSSRWWRCDEDPRLASRRSTLIIVDRLENRLEVDFTTGGVTFYRSETECTE